MFKIITKEVVMINGDTHKVTMERFRFSELSIYMRTKKKHNLLTDDNLVLNTNEIAEVV